MLSLKLWITEYFPQGSLQSFYQDDQFTPTKKLINLIGISDALSYLYDNKIFHCNLKPENILFDSNYYSHICDFDFSKCFSKSLTKSMQMSLLYLPFDAILFKKETRLVKKIFHNSNAHLFHVFIQLKSTFDVLEFVKTFWN